MLLKTPRWPEKLISSPSGPWTIETPGVNDNRSSNFRPRIGVVPMVVSLSVLAEAVRADVDGRGLRGDVDRFGDTRRPHRRRQPQRLTDVDRDAVLHQRREAGQRERHRIDAGRHLERGEAALAVGHQRPREIRADVAHFDADARQDASAGIDDDALDTGGGDLCLSPRGCRQRHPGWPASWSNAQVASHTSNGIDRQDSRLSPRCTNLARI